MMADDLTGWLLEQLDEADRREQPLGSWNFPFSRAGRDAKRRMIALHAHDREHYCPVEDGGSEHFNYLQGWAEEVDHPQICPTLRLLALPYADRPGYRPEWSPE